MADTATPAAQPFNLDNVNGGFLLDFSPSMAWKAHVPSLTRWNAGKESIIPVAEEVARRDDDGITIGAFAGQGQYEIVDNITEEKVEETFRRWDPSRGSGTYLARPLQDMIDRFFPKQYETRTETETYTAYENVVVDETYTEYEDVKVKNPKAGQKTGGLFGTGIFAGREPEFITERRAVQKTRQVTKSQPVQKTRQVERKGVYKKVSPDKQVFICVYTDGAAGDENEIIRVIVDATQRIVTRRDLGILFIHVGDPDATDYKGAEDFLDRLNNRLKPEGALHDIVAVVKLQDVEKFPPAKLLEQAFTA